MFGLRLISLACLVGIAACSGADGTAPFVTFSPGQIPGNTVMYAAGPTMIVGLPGEMASSPPSVRIVDSPTEKPVQGVNVSFTFSDGRGVTYSTVTNAKGLAVLERLRFDNRPGPYSITATVAGVSPVVFSAISVGGQLTAAYDLQRIGGQPPYVSGGHYQLFDDGTYRRGYDSDGQTHWHSREPFIRRSEGKIEFYISDSAASFYVSSNYVFAFGTLKGDTMTVVYEDYVDFDDEVYSLAK